VIDRDDVLATARSVDVTVLDTNRGALLEAVRSFAGDGDAASAQELVGRAWRTWLSHAELDDGRAAATVALEAPGGEAVVPWRARVLYADGVLAFRAGDMAHSLARNKEALRVSRASGDVRGESELHRGDVASAEEHFKQRDAGAGKDAYGDAWAQINWAAVDAMRGNHDAARQRLRKGRDELAETRVALDPDDQYELDWLIGKVMVAR
jgi:hypothetical protein